MVKRANKFPKTNIIRKLNFIFFLSLACAVVFAQTSDSLIYSPIKTAKKYRIGGVIPEGAKYTDPSVIVLLSGLQKGDMITVPGDKISDAIKALWKQSIFEDVQIIQDKIIGNDIFLIIRVVERPRLSKFKFEGDVKKSDADDIRNKIRLLKERVVTDYMLGTIKNTVHDFYLDKGYYYNKVDIITKRDTSA
ncbi:MAG: POTRA domain-containing protein, partial [Bacteroidia bacterium]